MEKAVMLIEQSGEHLRCLLNPEQLEIRRQAGVGVRRSLGGAMSGRGQGDDPLLFTGGGQTELLLDLLFDVSLAVRRPDLPAVDDVRELTAPLWNLAENIPPGGRARRPPLVRFLWGASWNLPGIVAAVSERLEHFTAEGKPRRSWLRLKLLRVNPGEAAEPPEPQPPPFNPEEAHQRLAGQELVAHDPLGGEAGERVDQISAERFGHPGYWRLLASLNNLDDPLRIAGQPLMIPADPDAIGGGRS